MSGVLEYLLDGRSIKGTYLEKRLIDATKDSKAAVLYKPRSGKISHDLSKFTEDQIKRFETMTGDTPYFYRYSDPTSKYCFFTPEEQTPDKPNY